MKHFWRILKPAAVAKKKKTSRHVIWLLKYHQGKMPKFLPRGQTFFKSTHHTVSTQNGVWRLLFDIRRAKFLNVTWIGWITSTTKSLFSWFAIDRMSTLREVTNESVKTALSHRKSKKITFSIVKIKIVRIKLAFPELMMEVSKEWATSLQRCTFTVRSGAKMSAIKTKFMSRSASLN